MVLLRDGCKAEQFSEELIAEFRKIYKKQKPPKLEDLELDAISSRLPTARPAM